MMRALSFTVAAMMLSLVAAACPHRSDGPDAVTPLADAVTPQAEPPPSRRPPPGTRIDAWPEVGVWTTTGIELPGSSDPFLWERPAEPTPPKAQVPLRLHRPTE